MSEAQGGSQSDLESKVQVYVRVRPLNDRETQAGHTEGWVALGKTLSSVVDAFPSHSASPIRKKKQSAVSFNFNGVFDATSACADVYASACSYLVDGALEGVNGTVFAYGQTSAGKTHTISGTSEDEGLIPRALRNMFDTISAQSNREYLVRVSYLEIYNETVSDLFGPLGDGGSEGRLITLVNDKNSGVLVKGADEKVVVSAEQALEFWKEGEKLRHRGTTKMNHQSSRSHTVFRVLIETRETSSTGDVIPALSQCRQATLNIVDLAGSERSKHTGAQGAALKEGSMINKSLSTLTQVISKLSEEGNQHIPFRDSKLTRLLQNALAGNSLTSVVCCITPSSFHYEESLSTLRFATRAMRVKTIAKVNEIKDGSSLLDCYRAEIDSLKSQLNQHMVAAAELSSKDVIIQKLEEEQAALKLQMKTLSSSIIHSGGPAFTPSDKHMRDRSMSVVVGADKMKYVKFDGPRPSVRPKVRRSFDEISGRNNSTFSEILQEKDRVISEMRRTEESRIQAEVERRLMEMSKGSSRGSPARPSVVAFAVVNEQYNIHDGPSPSDSSQEIASESDIIEEEVAVLRTEARIKEQTDQAASVICRGYSRVGYLDLAGWEALAGLSKECGNGSGNLYHSSLWKVVAQLTKENNSLRTDLTRCKAEMKENRAQESVRTHLSMTESATTPERSQGPDTVNSEDSTHCPVCRRRYWHRNPRSTCGSCMKECCAYCARLPCSASGIAPRV